MKLKLKTKEIKSAGLVSMKHLDKDGNILGERNFNNLLTDAYFAQNSFLPAMHIQIGTGTTPPEVTDTSLENFYQGLNSNTANWANITSFSGPVETATKINRNTRNATFSFTSSVLITEVGLGSSTSAPGGTLYARSLIKDEDGIPAPFQMEEGHQLTVSYVIDLELPQQLTEVATIASPWPAPYDGDISVVISAGGSSHLTGHLGIGSAPATSFAGVSVNVDRVLGSITYSINKSTAFGTSDTSLTSGTTVNIEGLNYYSNAGFPQFYHVFFRQERAGSDQRVLVPANHNFSIEFETGIDWGRKP